MEVLALPLNVFPKSCPGSVPMLLWLEMTIIMTCTSRFCELLPSEKAGHFVKTIRWQLAQDILHSFVIYMLSIAFSFNEYGTNCFIVLWKKSKAMNAIANNLFVIALAEKDNLFKTLEDLFNMSSIFFLKWSISIIQKVTLIIVSWRSTSSFCFG